MSGTNELTREGYERLQAELDRLETVGRAEIAEAILEAREHGDLSENAEYHAAKEEQAHLETRIARLRSQLHSATGVDAPAGGGNVVAVGCRVTIRYVPDEESESYQLVGSAEADAANGRLSVETPFGRALLGSHVGDEVDVQTPGGIMRLAVVAIDA